jgi:MoaA/NifB/PqqE/SkfB family radical SAM enzyme
VRSLALARRAVGSYLSGAPICASFEITHSCNARCKHCHLGGRVEEVKTSAEEYGRIARQLRPIVALVSGGEPLLRRDVEEIVRAISNPGGAPYVAMTTNGLLLSREVYGRLRDAGVDRFSISLDYPDERHDEFRGVPGLFQRIRDLATGLDGLKDKAINISCVVQRHNFREMLRIAELGRSWSAMVNFSTYTWLRTDNMDYLPPKAELPEFRETIERLVRWKKVNGTIRTSDYVLRNMPVFFENRGIPECKAGLRYVVVNADGTLSPCGLIMRDYTSLEELRDDFSRRNECQACYTSLRADCERPISVMAKDTAMRIA